MTHSGLPDFESASFLESHVSAILAFYHPRVFDPEGGFFGCFLDDGTCFDPASRHLVGSARYVANYAAAYARYGDPGHLAWARWGLDFLQQTHRQPEGHYAWLIENGTPTDARAMAYGHAFVMLAAARCVPIGIDGAAAMLRETRAFMDDHFWDEEAGAYADERDRTLTVLSPYRGQNANMHMCEALLAAWQATRDPGFLDRAERLAQRFTIDLTAETGGQVWEHYDAEWRPDFTYNIDAPNDRYKPWGFQPGHQTEWAKLLLMLDAERGDARWLPTAERLYRQAMSTGWDKHHGGLVYGVAPDGSFCATDKYFWVHAETIAAAWRLHRATGDEQYRDDYNRLWRWSWRHLIDHVDGAWYRVRRQDGSPIDNRKSPLGKTDYHTLGACWDVLSVLEDQAAIRR